MSSIEGKTICLHYVPSNMPLKGKHSKQFASIGPQQEDLEGAMQKREKSDM